MQLYSIRHKTRTLSPKYYFLTIADALATYLIVNLTVDLRPYSTPEGGETNPNFEIFKEDPSWSVPNSNDYVMEVWNIDGYIGFNELTEVKFNTIVNNENFGPYMAAEYDKTKNQRANFNESFTNLNEVIGNILQDDYENSERVQIQTVLDSDNINPDRARLVLANQVTIHWGLPCFILYRFLVKYIDNPPTIKPVGFYDHTEFKNTIVGTFENTVIFGAMFTEIGLPPPKPVDHWTLAPGWSNPGSTCFMDSVLACIFIHPQSPFIPNILDADFSYRMNPALVDVQNSLKSVIRSFMYGSTNDCSNFRRILADYLEKSGSSETFRYNMQDPADLYSSLMGIFNYHPMDITTKYKISGRRNYPDSEKEENKPSIALDPISIYSDAKIIKWPDAWSNVVEDLDESNPEAIKVTKFNITRADCVVVTISRKDVFDSGENTISEQEIEISRYMDDIINTGDAGSAANTGVFGELEVTPSERYQLMAAVYVPGEPSEDVPNFKPGGHYGALLYDNDSMSWYNYDDLFVRYTGPLLNAKLSDEDAGRLLRTRAVMLFYYKNEAAVAQTLADILSTSSLPVSLNELAFGDINFA
tara:strand:- start:124541 stop:126304 length:1764 start_codon:yes stop_codon:yes gene_type:complete